MQNDLLNRFLIKNSPIRGNIIKIQNSLEQLKTSLEIPKQIEEAFTQIITVCPMLAGTLKFDGGLNSSDSREKRLETYDCRV